MRHLEYDWYKYVLILAAVIGTFLLVFSCVNSNKNYESASIFFACYSYPSGTAFSDTVKNEMAGENFDTARYGKNLLRSVTLDYVSLGDENAYYQLLATRGSTAAAVIVRKMDADRYSSVSVEFTPEVKSLCGIDRDFEYLYSGDKPYALRIDNYGGYNGLSLISNAAGLIPPEGYTFREGEEEDAQKFYLIICGSGYNAGTYGKGKAENKQLFYVLNRFLSLYN